MPTLPSSLNHPASVADLVELSKAESMSRLRDVLETSNPPAAPGGDHGAYQRPAVLRAVAALVGFVLVVALYTTALQQLATIAP